MYLCEEYTLKLTLNLINEFLSFVFVKPSRAFEHPKHLQQNTQNCNNTNVLNYLRTSVLGS